MSDGSYTVTLSEVKSKDWDYKTDYQTIHFKQHSGDYILRKGSKKIASGEFMMQTLDGGDPDLGFNTGPLTIGQNLVYDRAKKTFDYDGTNYKPQKASTIEDLILSGILIVAKVRKFEDD